MPRKHRWSNDYCLARPTGQRAVLRGHASFFGKDLCYFLVFTFPSGGPSYVALVESEIQLSILPGIDRQVQTCGGAPFRGLLDFRCENLKIMGTTMLITLLLTTVAGLGAIKLRAFALENGTVKSFLGQFNGVSSMDHRAAPFEFMRPGETPGGPFIGTVPPSRWHHPWQAHIPPRPPGQDR